MLETLMIAPASWWRDIYIVLINSPVLYFIVKLVGVALLVGLAIGFAWIVEGIIRSLRRVKRAFSRRRKNKREEKHA